MSKKSYRPVLVALSIMLLGLFMLCAHKQTIQTPGEDLSGGDEEFRQELLEMLDLANDGNDTAMFAATDNPEDEPGDVVATNAPVEENGDMTSEDEAELLALLENLEEDAASDQSSSENQVVAPLPKPKLSAGDIAYNELMTEVSRLETILEQRSMQVDSLRRIIDNRSARILDLQTSLASASANDQYIAARPEPVIVSTNTFKSYDPIQVASGPYTNKYNEARRQFEKYNYDGCIATMRQL